LVVDAVSLHEGNPTPPHKNSGWTTHLRRGDLCVVWTPFIEDEPIDIKFSDSLEYGKTIAIFMPQMQEVIYSPLLLDSAYQCGRLPETSPIKIIQKPNIPSKKEKGKHGHQRWEVLQSGKRARR
jgi:hypothetical protein